MYNIYIYIYIYIYSIGDLIGSQQLHAPEEEERGHRLHAEEVGNLRIDIHVDLEERDLGHLLGHEYIYIYIYIYINTYIYIVNGHCTNQIQQ